MSERRDPLTDKWRRFQRLSPNDRSAVLRAMALLPLTELGLRIMGFQRWKEVIEHFSLPNARPQSATLDEQLDQAVKITRAVRSVELHGLGHPNCLERSMALWWMLRRAGIDGELRIGARKSESRFEAHAWVEFAGQVLNDSADVHVHYARFDAPIAAAEAEPSATGKADADAAGKAPF